MCVDFSVSCDSFPPHLAYLFSLLYDGVKNEVLVEYKHPTPPPSCSPVLYTEENVNMHITYSVTLEISAKRKIRLPKGSEME